ncbi:hypothetical protein L0B70_07930 [Kaistella sp. 97-N-M2]|uniref:hypothetical protein n=1 Tax=Kaistella sp. 97-N-M2 TaxID=2908645 RepID=UPI001F43526C|nr:hypothetical protein [Kaistella sp. 97-N-M2]UJF28797.1 hypothetical protein L0B70_07930 [Kaistella sp. 97-N-M2]
MKKVISVLSFLLIINASSCREVHGAPDDLSAENAQPIQAPSVQRDSADDSAAGGGQDEEPPRKDIQQWKHR